MLLWPAKFGLDKRGGSIVVLDGEGRVVARVGDKVEMGGGAVDRRTLEGNEVLDEQTERELFERCPGTYWLVSDLQASQRR